MTTTEKPIDPDTLTDDEWKQRVGKPEFMPASGSCIRGLVEDNEGNTWVFLDAWTNWAYLPYSINLMIHGQSIEIAARARWQDDPSPATPEGDVQLFNVTEWQKITGLTRPFEKKCAYAVKLPFKPVEIVLVDK
jgi:hypothetical protein